MKKRYAIHFSIIMILAVLLSACGKTTSESTQTGQSGTITISGAFALYPMMTRWAEEYQKLYPDVQFDVSAGGAGKGLTDALAGAVDIGMVSRTVTQEEQDKGAYPIAVTKDAVFPVINSSNPAYSEIMAQGITRDMFIKIFITGEITTWGEVIGDPSVVDEIHVYTRSDACGAAEMWAKFMGGVQDDLVGIGVNADPGILQAVISDPLGIGYNNLGYAFDLSTGLPTAGATAVPIDLNENRTADPDEVADTLETAVELIASEKYPSPPARLEFLVTNGKPEGLVQNFIVWILTDGQSFVAEAGYVQLTDVQIEESLGLVR